MRWLAVAISSLVAISLTGFSIKTVSLYVIFLGLSIWLVRQFLITHYELDFEVIFNLFEWFGYGTPHRIDRIKDAFNTSNGAQTLTGIPRPIRRSLDRIISHILRDFVCIWYDEVAKGSSFKEEAQRLLQVLSVEIYKRACDIDIQNLIEQVIFTFQLHLQRYNNSVAVVRGKNPQLKLSISSTQLLCRTYESQIRRRHIAITNSSLELNYLRIVIDSLLSLLIKNDEYKCNIGRFMLREVLAVKTVKPLTDLMSDPDWINEAVIAIFEEPFTVAEPPNKNLEKSDDLCPTPAEGWITQSNDLDSSDLKELEKDKDSRGSRCIEGNQELLRNKNTEENETREKNNKITEVESITDTSLNTEAQKQNKTKASCSTQVLKDPLEELTVERKYSNVSSSLSSSWSLVPLSRDKTFCSKSYENLRDRLLQKEVKGGSFKEITRLGTCCHTFETSSDVDQQDDKSITHTCSFEEIMKSRSLTRSQSESCAENLIEKCEYPTTGGSKCHQPLTRSVSVPTQLSSYKITSESVPVVNGGQIFEYGSPFYSISFRSDSDSYITASSEDEFDEVEEVEEADSFDDDHNENGFEMFVTDDASASLYHGDSGQLQKQPSFEENTNFAGNSFGYLQGVNRSPSYNSYKEQHEFLGNCPDHDGFEHDRIDISSGSFYHGDYVNKFGQGQLLKSSKSSQSSSSTVNSSRDSDSFLGETLTNAKENWKKLVSTIKPPSVRFKFTDGKSSEGQNQTHKQSDETHLDPGPNVLTGTSRKHLSRSDAVIDSDSDTEGNCGASRKNDIHEEIVYGRQDIMSDSQPNASDKGVIKIHPSQLIGIPTTELLSEIDDRGPGRNKFTVYHIEYDVRIWPDVYQLALYEARGNEEGADQNDSTTVPPDAVVCKLDEEELKKVEYKRVIKRRYREFMELHNRLVHGLHSKEMKAILKPNRKFNLPFGRLEPSVVEGRRTILQYYLVSLVSNPSLRESQELKEFLGVTRDGHVSFVKLSMAQMVSQSVHVPRVDKMLNRQMTKLIDKVKTAFDAVDEEEESPTRIQPVFKTFDTTSSDSLPWKLSYQSEHSISEEDTTQIMSTETFFDNFIDCQDFEMDDISQGPITVTQMNNFAVNVDFQDKNEEVPAESEFVFLENNHPDKPSEGQSSDEEIPNEDLLFEDIPQISSSSVLYGNENQPDPTFVETDNGVKSRPLGASTSLPPSRSLSMDKINLPKIAKGRISPTAVKNKLTSLASKGDDTWDIFKDNLKKINSQGEPWGTLKDNVKRIKNHSSCQELATRSKGNVEMLENIKAKQSAAWDNIKGNLVPKMKQSEAWDNFKNNLKFNQTLIDPLKKRQNGDTSKGESRDVHVTVPVCKESNQSKDFPSSNVTQPSSVKRDQPLSCSSTDRPSQHPADLTESVMNEDPQCPLANSIMQLLCEVFRGHKSWVCLDYVQCAFMGVFGGIFEWWLQGELDELVTEQRWGYYLKLFDEAIWPNDELKRKQPEKLEEDKIKTKRKAIKTLMEFFPGVFGLAVGHKTYEECAVNIVESLQHPEINRILLFELLELMLVEICPELQIQAAS